MRKLTEREKENEGAEAFRELQTMKKAKKKAPRRKSKK